VLHLSELHGAATHLAVVAIPVYAIILILRRTGVGHPNLAHVEPWALGIAAVGMAAAGITGLLVRGQAQTELRGGDIWVGTWHFWLGIALAVVLAALVGWRVLTIRRGRATHATELLLGGVLGVLLVVAQGYLGGRMTYDQGMGIDRGGQFAQTATGTARLRVALATGTAPATAGKVAYAAGGLGCARCHGDQAQGMRGPRLAGGAELGEFRRVHEHGLFPASLITARDFAAVDAYLRTLGPPRVRR
jgi:uncharacterized membrane protein